MIGGSCHCGRVRIEAPSAPEWVASCNCSICRKLGWLVAYWSRGEVTITGETVGYQTGDQWIVFRHCPVCACTTHWEPAPDVASRALSETDLASLTERIGINARLLDGYSERNGRPMFDGQPLEVRFRDNA